jgi:two-component system sensor histidine kinase MprB
MFERLPARIALAFAAVALITVAAVGATLFVALRSLHADAVTSALAQTSQPLVFQLRNAVLGGDLRATLSGLRQQVATEGVSVELITADGRTVDLGGEALAVEAIPIDPGAGRGTVTRGSIRFDDGQDHLYAATTLRGPNVLGPRAIVLSQVDTSGAEALRDLARTLPIVIILVALAGTPIAFVLARSVTGPLRRLASATADLPVAAGEPLPLHGPLEVRELTDRFNAMTAELVATREHETRLLADLRHDLRTPLTVIGGFATALADGTAHGADAVRAAAAIGEETARLERLVAELDATERLRDGAAGLRPERLDGLALAAETAQRFALAAAARGVTVVVSPGPIGGSSELIFAADRLAIERILGNLVENALSAVPSPGGHVWIAVQSIAFAPSDAPARGPAIAFIVTDDGPGFAPGAANRAFERFYRGDPSRSGPGTGLGLAIVRELARAHGGVALAENVAPHGARLSVVLPLAPVPADQAD